MTTVNENKIIADFMGFQHTPIGWFDADELLKLPNTTDNTFDELRFDVDWDWLMGVVDKIESLGYDVQIILDYCTITNGDYSETTQMGGNKIHNVYAACVEFIEWYNQLKTIN